MTFFRPVFFLCAMVLTAAEPPTAEIGNGKIRAKFYLPDAANGFYRGTRFDWSGVIFDFTANGHSYYGPWFTKRSSTVRDFVYEGDDIVAGPCSSTMGPADEFRPLGYDAAKPGETFVKIGVGALRKAGAVPYDAFRVYEIADHGKWTTRRRADSIEFTQELRDDSSGYAYVYRKTIRLIKGKSEMAMIHSLRNTGKKAIETPVYNHNFLVLDGKGPGPGAVITFPFAVRSSRRPNSELAEIQGNRIVYTKALTGRDVVTCPVEGFGEAVSDHEIRIENSGLKAGMSIQGDRPLRSINLWSIRSNISVEPFVGVSVEPGKEFRWTSTYKYYAVP
ncbi:MAG: hypothetical protein HYX27_02780 [Acidobacteria bacterium]|nr:hypothetical protein [Acidobacteriota bacterium]